MVTARFQSVFNLNSKRHGSKVGWKKTTKLSKNLKPSGSYQKRRVVQVFLKYVVASLLSEQVCIIALSIFNACFFVAFFDIIFLDAEKTFEQLRQAKTCFCKLLLLADLLLWFGICLRKKRKMKKCNEEENFFVSEVVRLLNKTFISVFLTGVWTIANSFFCSKAATKVAFFAILVLFEDQLLISLLIFQLRANLKHSSYTITPFPM